ncbi:hypothetical protein HanXRQr2_Chr09g0371151 [Helianthus annuus]|uniref:Uncharacterized protein n=1 Tax=Helianthus annuus TaxID=4232 RepID=A0A9K3I3U2_HELAN|nr:hypothetical protein HanXRQr2_Chr09g0371151 [Helianthus annuus]KAJ0541154.1 hypothetical protein HanHA89_Chr09g0325241 [Helianthus annuus]KAJ0706237.1 hypothetical protein HanLR1_Chr09g0304751 [Helianthus annuus]KAJ0891732.1 hypothetical protein HanPSC8_Chr09g0357541 [Helianthus annuus]
MLFGHISLSLGIRIKFAYISPFSDPTSSFAIGGILLGMVVVVI